MLAAVKLLHFHQTAVGEKAQTFIRIHTQNAVSYSFEGNLYLHHPLVPAPALHRQEHKHRKGSARMTFKNHFKLFWPETLWDFSDSPMRVQVEKSLLLEALTPHSSHTPVAAPCFQPATLLSTWKLCKQTQTAQNIVSGQCPPIQTGVIVLGGSTTKETVPGHILVALLAVHLVNGVYTKTRGSAEQSQSLLSTASWTHQEALPLTRMGLMLI